MKNKYITLNEEINRMKSMFTEERLYGNLVNESMLLTEQEKLLKALFKLMKSGKVYKVGDNVFKVEVGPKGQYMKRTNKGTLDKPVWSKKLYKIIPSDFISETLLKSIQKNVDSIDTIKGIQDYMKDGYYNDLKKIIDNINNNIGGLKNFDSDNFIKNLKTSIGEGDDNIFVKIMDSKELWDGTQGIDGFSKALKGKMGKSYDLIEYIPGLRKKLYSQYSQKYRIGSAVNVAKKIPYKGKGGVEEIYEVILNNKRFKDKFFGLIKPKELLRIVPPRRLLNSVVDILNPLKVQSHFNYKQLRNRGLTWKDLDQGQRNFLEAKYKDIKMPDGTLNPSPKKNKGYKEKIRSSESSWFGYNSIQKDFFKSPNQYENFINMATEITRNYPSLKISTVLTITAFIYWASIPIALAEALWGWATGCDNTWTGKYKSSDEFKKILTLTLKESLMTRCAIEVIQNEYEEKGEELPEYHKSITINSETKDLNLDGNIILDVEKSRSTDSEIEMESGLKVSGMKTKIKKCFDTKIDKIAEEACNPVSILRQKLIERLSNEGKMSISIEDLQKEDIINIIKNIPESSVKATEDLMDEIIEAGEEGSEYIKQKQEELQGGGSAGEQGGWGKVGN